MSINDFPIDTFTDLEVSKSSLDSVYEKKQQKASATKTWLNDEDMYKSQLDLQNKLRQTFIDIIKKLTNASKNSNELEKFIEAKMTEIGFITEEFWENLSRTKDVLSYKFGSRKFPENTETKSDWNTSMNNIDQTTQKTDKEKIAELARSTRERISKQYDVNEAGVKHWIDRNYVDEGSAMSKYTFKPLSPIQYYETLSISDLEFIFNKCFELKSYSSMLLLWCNLICSRLYVHVILQSERIVDLMFNPSLYSYEVISDKVKTVVQNPFLEPKYMEIVYNCLFYGIYILTREEFHYKINTTMSLRHVLDIRVLSKIPQYHGPMELNPFIPVSLSNKYLYATEVNNKHKIIRPIRSNGKDRGLYSLQSFKKRFEVFTGGIFEGLDYQNLYITGSIIPACLIRNPLELKYGINLPTALDDNYSSSSGRQNNVDIYWNDMSKNLKSYFDTYYPSKEFMIRHKITDDNVLQIEDEITDIDIIIDVLSDKDFDDVAMRIFKTITANITKEYNKAPSQMELNMIKVTTQSSYKYNIYGTKIIRNVELFRIYETQPMGCVSRFHFGPVRGVFNGLSVYVLPTLWNSAQSGCCFDYKWMSNSGKAQQYICKYFTRGFYVLLNDNEHESMYNYIKENKDKWGKLDELGEPNEPNGPSSSNVETRHNTVSVMNPIFDLKDGTGAWYDIFKFIRPEIVPTKTHYVSDDPNFETFNTPIQPSNIKSIDMRLRYDAGHIKPIQLWKIASYTHDLAHSKKYNTKY